MNLSKKNRTRFLEDARDRVLFFFFCFFFSFTPALRLEALP